jgi:hypothetical protein
LWGVPRIDAHQLINRKNMDAKDFANEMRTLVDDLKTKGIDSIKSENLIKYLDERLRDFSAPTPVQSSEATHERYKADLQRWVEEHKNIHAYGLETFRSVIQAGQNALRTAFIMNGGAAVALLAFIGHLSSVAPERVSSLAPSLAAFVIGVLIAALASGTTYLSQWFFAHAFNRENRPWLKTMGFILNFAAILFGLGAYVVFAYGMWLAYHVSVSFRL